MDALLVIGLRNLLVEVSNLFVEVSYFLLIADKPLRTSRAFSIT